MEYVLRACACVHVLCACACVCVAYLAIGYPTVRFFVRLASHAITPGYKSVALFLCRHLPVPNLQEMDVGNFPPEKAAGRSWTAPVTTKASGWPRSFPIRKLIIPYGRPRGLSERHAIVGVKAGDHRVIEGGVGMAVKVFDQELHRFRAGGVGRELAEDKIALRIKCKDATQNSKYTIKQRCWEERLRRSSRSACEHAGM